MAWTQTFQERRGGGKPSIWRGGSWDSNHATPANLSIGLSRPAIRWGKFVFLNPRPWEVEDILYIYYILMIYMIFVYIFLSTTVVVCMIFVCWAEIQQELPTKRMYQPIFNGMLKLPCSIGHQQISLLNSSTNKRRVLQIFGLKKVPKAKKRLHEQFGRRTPRWTAISGNGTTEWHSQWDIEKILEKTGDPIPPL